MTLPTDRARRAVRECLAAVRPQIDLDAFDDETPLLANRIITSFDLLELILHLERASGRPIARSQLEPGSFRDVATLARVFLQEGDSQ